MLLVFLFVALLAKNIADAQAPAPAPTGTGGTGTGTGGTGAAPAPAPAGPTPLPGDIKHVSAKGTELWALTKFDQIIRWTGSGWELFDVGIGRYVGATSTPGQAWMLSKAYDVYISTLGGKKFLFASWSTQRGFNINGDHGVLVAFDGCAYWHPNPKVGSRATKLDGDCNVYLVSEGSQSEIWKLDHNNGMFRFKGNVWEEIQLPDDAGKPIYLDVNSPKKIVVLDNKNNVYWGDSRKWVKQDLPDGAVCVEVSINDTDLFCLTADGALYKGPLA